MAGCQFNCCSLTLKPGELECIKRSTDRIDNCLSCDRGRTAFRDYLEKNEMKDDLSLLSLWEMCRRALETTEENRNEMFNEVCQVAIKIRRFDQYMTTLLQADSKIDDATKNIKEWCAEELQKKFGSFKTYLVGRVQGQRS